MFKRYSAAYIYIYIYIYIYSPDGDTVYFDIVTGVLQGDTLAPYLFIIYLDYVLRTSIDKMKKKNGFKLRGSLNKFPDFFRIGTFIDSIHMKL